jgi:uncharacterized protein CbrC (UPF0167 family)
MKKHSEIVNFHREKSFNGPLKRTWEHHCEELSPFSKNLESSHCNLNKKNIEKLREERKQNFETIKQMVMRKMKA